MMHAMKPTDDRWRQMVEDIAMSDADGVICTEMDNNLLAGYIDALLTGEEPDPLYAGLHRHVIQCDHCTAEVDAMLYVLRSEQARTLAAPSRLPEPDLAFLAGSPPAPTIGARLRDLFTTAEGWVRDQGSIWIAYGVLLGQSGQPVLARAVRNAENIENAAEKPLQRISLGVNELEDCDLEIAVWRSGDPAFCKMVVQVNIPSRWPLLSDVEVVAILGEQKWVRRTDGNGRVEFEEMPADRIEQVLFRVTLP